MHSYILLYGCSPFCVLNVFLDLRFYYGKSGKWNVSFATLLYNTLICRVSILLFAEFQNSWSNIAAFKTDDENILFHVT